MSSEASRSSLSGYVMIASAALIWGSIGVIVRVLPLSALTIVEYRVMIALPFFLIPWLRYGKTHGLRGPNFKLLIVSGVIQAVAWAAFFTAFKMTGIANAVVLLYTAPIFVALWAPYLLSEPRESRAYISLLLATVGILFIFANEGLGERLGFFGALSGLLAGFLFAFVIMLDRRLSQEYPSKSIVAVQLLVATIMLAPTVLMEQRALGYYEVLLLVILGVVHTGVGLHLYLEGLRLTLAQHAVIIQYLEPTSAFLYAALLLSELPDLISLLGCILIIAANFILIVSSGRSPSSEEKSPYG